MSVRAGLAVALLTIGTIGSSAARRGMASRLGDQTEIATSAPASPDRPEPAVRCATIRTVRDLPIPTTVIASASLNPHSDARPAPNPIAPPTPALPEHCEIVGRLNERDGAGGQHYATAFRLRLPTDWNGRFFFQGGGGSNGTVGNAFGALQGNQPSAALALGYAVVSQDSGHDNMVNNDPMRGGSQTFGFDPEARADFGYRSYGEVARTAKALIARYYGRPPDRSYYVGCSEGGREGLVISQRFGDAFDGVLACSPGLHLPQAAVAEAWDSQAFADVARAAGLTDTANQPFLNKTFTDDDLLLVSNVVLEACDALDGATDGMVQDFTGCTTAKVEPRLAAHTCSGPKTATCLTTAQLAALRKVFDGARTSAGRPVYAGWPWDAGIGGKVGSTYNQGWRIWKLGAFNAQANSAINLTLGASSLPSIFVTPPVPVASWGGGAAAYSLKFDIDAAPRLLASTSGTFHESALQFMKADATELSAFRRHGGKLLIAQGVSDPVFSILDTVEWWRAVDKANRGRASDFVRLFAVPGMNHCSGGPATDQFDAFGALVDWVERGIAPERIVATARESTPWPGRTRPLCAYPKQARYKGTGSLETAESFVCR